MRWAVAAGILKIHHIAGKKNPADILSKHWDLPSVYDTMKPLLFSHVKSDAASQEKLSGANKMKSVGKLVSKEDTNTIVKSTNHPKKDSVESQSHQGEC